MELRKGDLIEVRWIDIFEDLTGDPDKGDIYPRVSIGYFWDIRPGKHGADVFLTTNTMETDEMGQNGYCAYPLSCVVGVNMVRRGRGKEYKERAAIQFDGNQRTDQQGVVKPRRRKSVPDGVEPVPVGGHERRDVPEDREVGEGSS